MLQTFELHTPNLCRFRAFMISSSGAAGVPEKQQEPHHEPGASANQESPACDIITGNLRLYRFSAFMQSVGSPDDAADDTPGMSPTRCVVFNTVANTFVGVVENRITVWNGNSGAKIEEPVAVRDADICAIAFDSPRQRKLYIATSVRLFFYCVFYFSVVILTVLPVIWQDGAIRLYNPVTGALLYVWSSCLLSSLS
jgi:hypothetical protein